MSGGRADTLLGYPVELDASVGSIASAVKIIAFGDWSAYWMRDVRGLRLERSTDVAFATNQTAYRGLLRTDGGLVDTQGPAINVVRVGT
jgi:HK97 family phage major capsid protein